MKTVSAVLVTTHVDKHNEAFALSALKGMAEQLNRSYLPVGVEHDPRIPPIGRVVSGEVREREDGEFEIFGQIEIFEAGDRVQLENGDRRTVVRYNPDERVAVVDDRTFQNAEDQALLNDVRLLLGARAETEAKKAVEPITLLTIAATIVGTKIAEGFVGQIGGDVWGQVKGKLKQLFRRRRNSPAQLLNLAATVQIKGERRLVEVILSDPSENDIDAVHPSLVDDAVANAATAIETNPALIRFVYAYSHADGLRPRFAVAVNGAPVLFDMEPRGLNNIDHLSLGGGAPPDPTNAEADNESPDQP